MIPMIAMLSSCKEQNESKSIETYLGNSIEKSEIKSFLNEKMKEYKIPGLAFGLVNEGKIVQYETLGYADREQGLPVTQKTGF